MKRILIISNGHGEDLVGAQLIRKLPEGLTIDVFPLVGTGKYYDGLPVGTIGPSKNFPSGGFSARNLFTLPSDIKAGYINHLNEQWHVLKDARGKYDLVIAIGDLIPLAATATIKTPFIFIGVNKSKYYHSFGYYYTAWEKWMLKKAEAVFTRDPLTAQDLQNSKIKALYFGNPLMDCIGYAAEPAPVKEDKLVIGFLPGTREEDIFYNIQDFYLVSRELKKLDRHFEFLIATGAGTLDDFTKTGFADVLEQADVIVGLSGTGNEQAAGRGKPVVAFPGRGSQYTRRFALAQKQLLGEALCLTERKPEKVAEAVWSILNDHIRYEYMSHTGKERMGEPGAIEKIAKYIMEKQR